MTQRSETERVFFLDLSTRAKLRVTGADRSRFLNGQITNDLRKASEKVAIEACILTAKGKMDAHVFVRALGDGFLIDAEEEVRETLRARLERYVISDDVQIEDVTGDFSLLHVQSPESPSQDFGRIVSAHRFSEPGWDIWNEAGCRDPVLQQLSSAFAFVDSAGAEVMRIEQGIPRWGFELTQEIIPIEANLEQRTVDYQKGCYIGQEVISRMKMSGQTNKRLCGFISLDDVTLRPGMKVAVASAEAKEVGWITSATRSERLGKQIALGYAKRGFNNVGTKLNAISPNTDRAISVELVPLPFV